MIKLTKIAKSLLVGFFVVGMVSCGGTSNNDQGTSFLAIGYYADSTGEIGQTGDIVPLFSDVAVSNIDGLETFTYFGMRNNLTSQFIRLVRIDCDYSVAGSFIDIPSESYASSTIIGAAPTADTAPATAVGGFGSIAYFGFQILSPDLYSFINNNKASFPSVPFRMTATCSATGITQAGDVLTTNPLHYFIQFVEQAECCTDGNNTTTADGNPDFQVGAGSGGNLVTEPTAPVTNAGSSETTGTGA